MSNNQQKYKKSKVLNGIFGGILALVIAGGVVAVGVLSNGFKDWNKFKKDDTKQEQPMPRPKIAAVRILRQKQATESV